MLLEGVEAWFESLWGSISSWITGGLSALWNTISAGIDGLANHITVFLDRLWDKVRVAVDLLANHVTVFLDLLWGKIRAAFNTVSAWISSAVSGLWDKVRVAFDLAANHVTVFLDRLWDKIRVGVDSLANHITVFLDRLWDKIQLTFRDLWAKVSTTVSGVITSLRDSLTLAVGTIAGYVQDALKGVAEALGAALGTFFGLLLKSLRAIVEAVSDAAAAVRDFAAPIFEGFLSSAAEALAEAAGPGTLPKPVEDASKNLAEKLMEGLKEIAPKTSKSLPAFEEVNGAAMLTMVKFVGLEIVGNVTGIAIDMVHPIKPIGVQVAIGKIVSAITSNVATAPVMTIPLEASTYRPLRYHYNALYPYVIPGSGDLITFVVREVITPEKFYELMPFHGFDKEVAGWYWESHWVLIAFGQLREAMWRKIITPEEFSKFIVLHDYKPEPRPGIARSDQDIVMALSYELPGRIDARWMFEQGVIDTAEHRELTAKRGMLPEYIDKVTEAEERASVRTEIEASVRRWAELTREGFLTGEELRSNVVGLGLGDKLAGFWAQRAAAEQQSGLLIDEKKAILRAYETDRISRDECSAALTVLGVIKDVRDRELRISDIKRIGKARPTVEELRDDLAELKGKIAAQEAEVASRTAAVTEAETMETETLEVLDMEIVFARADLAAAVEVEDVEKFKRRLALLLERRDVTATRLAASIRRAGDALAKAEASLAELAAEKTSLEAEITALGG